MCGYILVLLDRMDPIALGQYSGVVRVDPCLSLQPDETSLRHRLPGGTATLAADLSKSAATRALLESARGCLPDGLRRGDHGRQRPDLPRQHPAPTEGLARL